MTHPLVSVIMPAYNTEKYIGEAIESIISQTYTNWELIIVNDGSTDKSGEFAEEFARHDSRIKVFHQDNEGAPAARNRGWNKSNGEYIVFMDSDDILTMNALETQVKEIIKCRCDVVYGDWKYIVHRLNRIKISGICHQDLHMNPLVSLLRLKWTACFSYMVSRRILGRQPWDEIIKVYQDFDYIINIIKTGDVMAYNNNVVGYYRIHSSLQISRNSDNVRVSSLEHILKKLERRKEELNECERYEVAALYHYLAQIAFRVEKSKYEVYLKNAYEIYPKYRPRSIIIRCMYAVFGGYITETIRKYMEYR